MKRGLLYTLFFLVTITSNAQIISIVGQAVGGWPDNDPATSDTHILSTVDNVNYSISDLVVENAAAVDGGVKFRLNGDWATNWGSTGFPNGTGVQNGANIPTVAGIYTVNFNRNTGAYSFVSGFPSIGIWGPAVNSQLGFGAPDVDMTTTDGIIYTLSGFNFSSGNAYFRQDDASIFVWGTVAFPTGTAILGGPTIFIPGGEWFVTFNRNTGAYSFTYPSVGILGTATPTGWGSDTDLSTNDGFSYTLLNFTLTDGFVKFRKDNSWITNWGSSTFPTGTGTQDGLDIPVTAGTYNVSFESSSGNYSFTNTLSNPENSISKIKIYPNPTLDIWNLMHNSNIDTVELFDITGKTLQRFAPNAVQFQLDGSTLSSGVYFVKIKSGLDFTIQKIIKN